MIEYDVDGTCPVCATANELASPLVTNARPLPGDVSVCVTCATPAVFEDCDGPLVRLRALTPDEWIEVVDDSRTQVARFIIIGTGLGLDMSPPRKRK